MRSNNYYPFGSPINERSYSIAEYKYGFNGQERDNEVSDKGNSYTAEFWQYDPRLARRWNLDPKPNPSISFYNTFAGNPIWFSDPSGDTIKISEAFKNNKKAMERYNLWKESKAGKKFHKRYDVGGKYGNVSVNIDLFTDEEEKKYGGHEGFTESFGMTKISKRKLSLNDQLQKGEYLNFRIAVNSKSSSFSTNTFKSKRSTALTILHETQHLRIIHYGFRMYNTYKYSSSDQHYIMRTNLNKGSEYKKNDGEVINLSPNGIYDFNAERWQFMQEYKIPGETNEDIDREIGGFMN